jgi:uncharacterized protein (TIGR03083 family)
MSEPGIVADSSRSGLTAQLHEIWDALIALGSELDDADWATPTPCPGWPVSAQYAHVIGTESMLLGRPNPDVEAPAEAPGHVHNDIGGFNEVWVRALSARPRAEVMEQLGDVVAARKEALSAMTDEDFAAPSWTPVGRATYARFMQIRVFDCWVHEQDGRDGLGRPGHETGPVAEQSIDEIVRAAGFVIGKKAGAPVGTGVRIDLTGPLTRRIEVEVTDRARVVGALAGPATTGLELSSTAYSRLSTGRIAPSEVAGGALGGVRIHGDGDLAQRVLANLGFTI